jgi:hypothetical protein
VCKSRATLDRLDPKKQRRFFVLVLNPLVLVQMGLRS